MIILGKIKRGVKWLVVSEYDGAGHKRGEIVSQHASYAAANKRARQSTFWAVISVEDARS